MILTLEARNLGSRRLGGAFRAPECASGVFYRGVVSTQQLRLEAIYRLPKCTSRPEVHAGPGNHENGVTIPVGDHHTDRRGES